MKRPSTDVLIIGAADSADLPVRLEAALREEGLAVRFMDEGASHEALPGLLAGDELPSAVLLLETVASPLGVARRVHSLAPSVQIVFVACAEHGARLRKELAGTLRIGRNWSIVDPDDAFVQRALSEAIRATQQRQRLRTTLDRMNLKIQQRPPPVDDATYRKLVVSDRYVASVLEHAGDAILAVDPDGRITTWNFGAEQLFGYEEVEALERTVDLLVREACRDQLLALVREALAGHAKKGQALDCARADGSPFSAAVTVAPLWGERDRVDAVVVIARDVTERKRAEAGLLEANQRLTQALEALEATKQELLSLNAQLEIQATTDSLTGLKNRVVFHNSLAEMIAVARRSERPLSLLLIDVDHFKRVNDRWGHLEGDRVLKEIASELNRRTREQDVVARFGGEEFVVLLPDTHLDAAVHVGEQLRACCAQTLEDDTQITISVGVAEFEPGDTDVSLIERADRALYAAKEAGRNRVVRADPVHEGEEKP